MSVSPTLDASRRLHGRVARTVAEIFRSAGVDVPDPTAAFYLYPSFRSRADGLALRGVRASEDLARALLRDHGIATLAGTAFGDDPENLTLRVATPTLYGADAGEREEALESDDPTSLLWVRRDLDTLGAALAALVL